MCDSSSHGCAHCGSPFNPRSPRQRFCSGQCRNRDRDRRESKTGLCRADYLAARKALSVEKLSFVCVQCGIGAVRRVSKANRAAGYENKYCSMKCRDAAVAAASHQAKLSKGLYSACFAMYCKACSKPFVARREKSLCSRACEVRVAAKVAHTRAAAVSVCQECRSQFCPLYGYSHRALCTTCSDIRRRAHKQIARLKRKARERAAWIESVNPIKVFERDGWRCRLCHIPTPKEKRGTYDDDAPELDHVMPLALGGDHSYSNTQCACRRCNREKADSAPSA